MTIIFDGVQTGFKYIYAGVVHAEVILSLAGIVNILLYVRGIDNIQDPTDLVAVVGMDYFISDRSSNMPLFTFLSSINIFSIWYLVTLSIGISILTGFGKLKSGIVVTSVWLLSVGYQVALVGFARPSA